MEEVMKSLKQLVVEEDRCVTKSSLLRQTSLSTHDIEQLMLEFYKRHPQLTALVLVTGMKKTDNGDLVRQSAISRMNLLEKTKAGFESIISESIWSLCRDSSVDVSKLLDTTWPGKYEKPVVSYASRLRIVSDRAIEAVKNADKCPNLFWSGYVIPSFSTVVDQPVGSSSGIRHGQHSLMDAFANVIKYNEKLVKMEAEKENDQDTLKRPNAGDDTDSHPATKKTKIQVQNKKSKPQEKAITSFFKKA